MGPWIEELDKAFKALADRGRRLLLDRLRVEGGKRSASSADTWT